MAVGWTPLIRGFAGGISSEVPAVDLRITQPKGTVMNSKRDDRRKSRTETMRRKQIRSVKYHVPIDREVI